MSISFACSDCGSKYKVADAAAGKKVKCKKCGNVMVIPSLVPAGADEGVGLQFKDESLPAAKPRPAAARPTAARPAPAKPAARRPAPPPPPVEDNSLDDLAALAHGELLPPEELPTAPAYTPPASRAAAAPVAARGPQLGYATPRKLQLEQPAYIGTWGGFLILATFIAPLIRSIIVVTSALSQVQGQVNYSYVFGFVAGGAVFAVAIICLFVAPMLLVGIKIAGKIMGFATEPGGYKNVLMVLGISSVLGVVSTILQVLLASAGPEIQVVIGCIIMGLSLFGMVRILKDAFVINWAQTAVAAVMAIAAVIATVLVIGLMIAIGLGGVGGVLKILDKIF